MLTQHPHAPARRGHVHLEGGRAGRDEVEERRRRPVGPVGRARARHGEVVRRVELVRSDHRVHDLVVDARRLRVVHVQDRAVDACGDGTDRDVDRRAPLHVDGGGHRTERAVVPLPAQVDPLAAAHVAEHDRAGAGLADRPALTLVDAGALIRRREQTAEDGVDARGARVLGGLDLLRLQDVPGGTHVDDAVALLVGLEAGEEPGARAQRLPELVRLRLGAVELRGAQQKRGGAGGLRCSHRRAVEHAVARRERVRPRRPGSPAATAGSSRRRLPERRCSA